MRHLRACLLLSLIAITAACTSVPPAAAPTCTHRNAEVEVSIGYCQAVRAGNELYISGVAGVGPMEAAVAKVYQSLGDILKANGLTFQDVVKENVYATDLDAFIANSGERKAYYGGWLPSATWVQVQRLFRPSLVVEVELVARYPSQKR